MADGQLAASRYDRAGDPYCPLVRLQGALWYLRALHGSWCYVWTDDRNPCQGNAQVSIHQRHNLC